MASAEDLENPMANEDFDRALGAARRLAEDYLDGLRERPVAREVDPAELAAALDEPLPEKGCDPAEALAEWWRRAEPGIVASPGPRFFGFVNGGATPAALAGDWLASALDQNAGLWLCSPAAAETEAVVLRWLKELFGLPAAWAGGITSGATMANLIGLAAARQWVAARLGFDATEDGLAGQAPIRVLSSTEIHASAIKALGVLGIGRASLRKVAARDGAIDLEIFRTAIADIDAPVIVVGNAGEVNTGSFDDLGALAELCAAHAPGAWLHVDAAFGLFAALAPEHAHLLRGIERAHSVAADAHKWLNVPYDCGFAFVRDAEALRGAFRSTAAYLAVEQPVWNPSSHVPESSRRFRALALWCTLKAYGRAGIRAIVERGIANAVEFAAWVAAEDGLELTSPATLNIVCFRLAPADRDEDAADDLNRRAVRALQADGRVFVSGTVWAGRAAIRAAFDNWMTDAHDVAILKQAVADLRDRLLES
jgi:glutamate/tyrosine decarboxylase-like PLP-dependent enzyme